MKLHILIPLATVIAIACATKSEPCGDGMARADDGNCYELGGTSDDTATNNQLPDSDADGDGDGDADGGPPPDEGGDDEGPPPDEGGDDEGPPPDEGGEDEGPPPDDEGVEDADDGGDGGPPDPDEGGDEGPPPDGPSTCEDDDECDIEDDCFGDGTGCICDDSGFCTPTCDSDDDCPEIMSCVDGVCDPGDGPT